MLHYICKCTGSWHRIILPAPGCKHTLLCLVLFAGSASGTFPPDNLTSHGNGFWSRRLIPPIEEVITINLTVNGQAAGTNVLTTSGISPFFINYQNSLANAVLVSKGMTATDPLAGGLAQAIYMGESSFVNMKVLDNAGNRCATVACVLYAGSVPACSLSIKRFLQNVAQLSVCCSFCVASAAYLRC